MIENISQTCKWLNDNQGVISLAIFIATLLLGWVSGIFSALRRRPKFQIQLIDGPTFVCTFQTGKKYNHFDVHRTGIALYLKIANLGSAASSINKISVGYHWQTTRFTRLWLKYGLGWFWLHNQTPAIDDFQTKIGNNIKFYPFLLQKSIIAPAHPSSYLEPGQSENGVVYFEQDGSFGACRPSIVKDKTKVKVCITDVFGSKHITSFKIKNITLKAARTYNPSFGKTLAELHDEPMPHDSNT
jgi:hypothetical protein